MSLYRLKLISPLFGVDDAGPLHPSVDAARAAARLLRRLYHGRVRVEIHRVIDLRLRRSECVEAMDELPPDEAGPTV